MIIDHDTHEEWIEDNEDKAARQERARKEKQRLIDDQLEKVKVRSYAVYRRAGLMPWCALRLCFIDAMKPT
jgi:hypothetical protein